MKNMESGLLDKIKDERRSYESLNNQLNSRINIMVTERKVHELPKQQLRNTQLESVTCGEQQELWEKMSTTSSVESDHDFENTSLRRNGSPNKKRVIQENVVLLMDSNRKYIEEKQFWNKTKKIRVPTAAELEETIEKFDFSKVEHVIIGTGTNDSDTRLAEEIFPDLRQAAVTLKQKHETLHVYVSQLPPRKSLKKDVIKDLNSLIAEGLPESIHTVLQDDLKEQHLYDEKHVMKKKIGIYAKNMKDQLKAVLGIVPKHNTRDDTSTNALPRQQPKTGLHKQRGDVGEASLVADIVAALERSNKATIDNILKNIRKT